MTVSPGPRFPDSRGAASAVSLVGVGTPLGSPYFLMNVSAAIFGLLGQLATISMADIDMSPF